MLTIPSVTHEANFFCQNRYQVKTGSTCVVQNTSSSFRAISTSLVTFAMARVVRDRVAFAPPVHQHETVRGLERAPNASYSRPPGNRSCSGDGIQMDVIYVLTILLNPRWQCVIGYCESRCARLGSRVWVIWFLFPSSQGGSSLNSSVRLTEAAYTQSLVELHMLSSDSVWVDLKSSRTRTLNSFHYYVPSS